MSYLPIAGPCADISVSLKVSTQIIGSILALIIRRGVARWHIFRPETPNLGKNFRALQMKVYFIANWYNLWTFGIF
jgi:hypothetical protein